MVKVSVKKPLHNSFGSWIKTYWQSLTLVLFTFLALALRLYHLETQIDATHDALMMYVNSAYPLKLIIPYLWPDHSPLFFFLSHFALALTNYSHDLVLQRLPTVLIGTLVIPAIYLLVSEITTDKRVIFLTTFAATFFPLLVELSRSFRMYSLLILLSTLSTYCLLRSLRNNQWQYWLGFVLITTLNLYNHYIAFLLAFEVGVFVLLWLISNLATKYFLSKIKIAYFTNPSTAKIPLKFDMRQVWWRILGVAISFAVIFLLYLPWLGHLIDFIRLPTYGINSKPISSLAPPQYNVASLTYQIFSLSGLGYDGFWLSFPILLIGFGWLLFRRFYYSLLFLCLFGILLPLLLLLPVGGTEDLLNNQRYFSFLTPFYVILLAQGVVAIFELVIGGLSKFRATYRKFSLLQWRIISMVPVLLLSALIFSQVINIYTTDQVYNVQKDYVDYTTDFLVQNLQPDAVVVVAAPKLQGKARPQEFSRNDFIVETFLSRMSANRSQDTSVLSHFIEFEQLDSLSELRRLQLSTANIWLLTSLDGTVTEQKAKRQRLDAVNKDGLVVNCFDVICLVGFDNNKIRSQYDRLQKQLKAAVFLNSGFANKAEELAAMDIKQLKQLPFKNENQNVVALSKQPYYVGLPANTSLKSQTFCVKYKYRGTLSRVFVGAQDDKGNNIAILPDWDGYYPRPTNSVFSDWRDEGFIFKAPPGTARATLVLLAETNLAEVKDFELFEVLTDN